MDNVSSQRSGVCRTIQVHKLLRVELVTSVRAIFVVHATS